LKNEETSIFNGMAIKLRFIDSNCNVRFAGMRRIGFLAACYSLSNNFLDVSLNYKLEEDFSAPRMTIVTS